jgi:hypothetical protein
VVLDDHPDSATDPKRVYTTIAVDPAGLRSRPADGDRVDRARAAAFARSAGIETPTLDAIESICVSLAEAKGLYSP